VAAGLGVTGALVGVSVGSIVTATVGINVGVG
jgi:hypothetical protein